LTVEICRRRNRIGSVPCAAPRPPLIAPKAHGQANYPLPSDQRSTKPWQRRSPSETPERCRRLGNGPRNWLGCLNRTTFLRDGSALILMPFVSITRLRVRSYRYLPGFLIQSFRAARQARRAAGSLAVSVLRDADRAFWTRTAWRDEAATRAFMRSGVHRRIRHDSRHGAMKPPWRIGPGRQRTAILVGSIGQSQVTRIAAEGDDGSFWCFRRDQSPIVQLARRELCVAEFRVLRPDTRVR
jgi:heme-degrading monooxygenase HmoA